MNLHEQISSMINEAVGRKMTGGYFRSDINDKKAAGYKKASDVLTGKSDDIEKSHEEIRTANAELEAKTKAKAVKSKKLKVFKPKKFKQNAALHGTVIGWILDLLHDKKQKQLAAELAKQE
jgi:hypothetical protein